MKARDLSGWVVILTAAAVLMALPTRAAALDVLKAPASPPTVERILPPPDSLVRELAFVEVEFDRPVAGLDAADLLVNGTSATNVTEFAPGQFVFSFAPPQPGPVTLSWRSDHGIKDAAEPLGTFAGDPWNYTLDPTSPPAGLIISEFMAENNRTLRDDNNDYSDWIELFNGADEPVSLAGYFLTDDRLNLSKWRFPDVSIGAHQYLVLFASEKNETNVAGRLHTNFKLSSGGEYLALLSPRTNVISEFAPGYPEQQPDISFGRARGADDNMGYFVQPTPGSANAATGAGFAGEVTFSRSGGTFQSPFALVLATPSQAGVIRYTLDGNLPTNSSPVYIQPIQITNSVQVRARVFADGLLPGPPRTETFMLLSTNLNSFTSDLPVLVFSTLGKAGPSASRQSGIQLAVFEPKHGVTSLTNRPSLTTRAGIKVRGSSTQGLSKSSYALELWDEFDQDGARELLGMPADSDWVLYAPNTYEPVLIHNPFIHQLSRDMGRYSPRTRFVEVYLNRSAGPVSSNTYVGIYVLEEKIKIGPHRVDIDRLGPEDTEVPDVTGGYLLKIDRLDPGDSGLSAGGQLMGYVDPKEREIRSTQRDPQEQYIKTFFSNFGRALNSPTWRDPAEGYPAYIDQEAWIDFHVLELLSGNVDAIVLSTYFHKPRNGKIVFGPHWDFDRALGSTDGRDANPRAWTTGPFFSGWWGRLFRDPDFWQKWVDRYEELRLSHFSQTNINRLIDSLANEVRQAQPRERQKWRVPLRGGTYQAELDRMRNWLSNRMDFIDRQLVALPKLSLSGGPVSEGTVVTLTAPSNATVYYTLDGSDPRSSQGGVSPQARTYTGPLTVNANVHLVARARNLAQRQTGGPPVSSPWSGLAAATFVVSPPPLLLTELMFNPAPPANGSTNGASDFEYLELLNVSSNTVQLPGYRFTRGIEFAFTSNALVTRLAPGERLLLVKNAAAFKQRYPGVSNIAGEFGKSLDNTEERLTLVGPRDEPVFDLTYHESWGPLADGFGFSLVLRDESITNAGLQQGASWRLSSKFGGSPGRPDSAPPTIPHVVINELLANPGPSQHDSLELFNPGAASANVSGWYLTDDFRSPKKLRLPMGTSLPPGGFLIIDLFSSTGASLAFSKSGEQVYLFSADAAGNLTGWFHGYHYEASDAGVTFGRYITSTGEDKFVAQIRPTLGTTNSGPLGAPVVISEIRPSWALANTPEASAFAYIELYNPGAKDVELFDPKHATNTWRLRGTVDFDFPPGIVLPANAYLLLVSFDPREDALGAALFRSRYGSGATPQVLGPWSGELSASGVVRLLRPAEPEVASDAGGAASVAHILMEQVAYSDVAPWPDAVAENGMSLQRRDVTAFSDDPANWRAAPPCPGDADQDADGLPDRWEARYGLDGASGETVNGPEGDADGDGFSNAQELASGTDPRDAGSCLKLIASVESLNRVHLQLVGVPGHSYTIEYSDTLREGSWQVLARWVSSMESSAWEYDDVFLAGRRFYRVRLP